MPVSKEAFSKRYCRDLRTVVPLARWSPSRAQPAAQPFLATHAAIYNTFYAKPHLVRRPTLNVLRGNAMQVWKEATAA